MDAFGERLEQGQSELSREDRRWVYVSYDRLDAGLEPFDNVDPSKLGIVLIESRAKAMRRPYHRQKLGWVLGNQRRFALEQSERGVAVHYVRSRDGYSEALSGALDTLAGLGCERLDMVEPSEREMRAELDALVDAGKLCVREDESWLTTPDDFSAALDDEGRARMDRFYRAVRQRTGILMDGDSPEGGKYSFDSENRKSWKGEPAAPELPTFETGDIEAELDEQIRSWFPDHPGTLDLSRVPTRSDDHEQLWTWAKASCLPHFGPFQDAMSERSSSLFHARISASMNFGRLSPQRVLDDALALDLPLASREGFVRQILGWREFVRHVHRHHEGFTNTGPVDERSTDGGWSTWKGKAWPQSELPTDCSGAPEHFTASMGVPPAYWGAPSGLRCLDQIVEQVWQEGYGHHISRLMVLSNLATTLGMRPREVTDWFWAAYADALDWVVEPNVLGMGTYALGDAMTTKPYVCGGNYISRMSDFCGDCAFDPKKNCPVTAAYWDFLRREEKQLEDVPRMQRALWSLGRRSDEKKKGDQKTVRALKKALEAGDRFEP